MKKIASILLLVILLFNWTGYRFFTAYLQDQATRAMTEQLNDEQYDESELLSIKIPANLPYYGNSLDFERVDGQIEIAGVYYNYVKRRVYKDSLEYMCIPNIQRTKIAAAGNEFYKLVNNLKQSTQDKKSGGTTTVKNPFSDLYQEEHEWPSGTITAIENSAKTFISALLPDMHYRPAELPPDTPELI